MNSSNPLTVLVFPDLLAWEREALEPLLACLSKECNARIQRVERGAGRLRISGPVWILAHRWADALQRLVRSEKDAIFVSVLGMRRGPAWWPSLILGNFYRRLSSSVTLVAHSPLSYRFLKEIVGVEKDRLKILPLPFHVSIDEKTFLPSSSPLTVATFTRFNTETNLNYFLTLAHYIAQRRSDVKFRIVGGGRLASHFQRMTEDLGLDEQVRMGSDFDPKEIGVVVYHPLHNHHFLPVSFAASYRLPVLASELPGIEEFIGDGREGFIIPVNETKPMAELILRLLSDSILRRAIADRLCSRMLEQFGLDRIVPLYRELLSLKESVSSQFKAA